ncbi:MAG: hypothetical protein C4586_00335 [Anaerolineaceae bacterium]|nr:MAG: hypothetical protein C4586_00335 [Anaerolineaceae bacterium]
MGMHAEQDSACIFYTFMHQYNKRAIFISPCFWVFALLRKIRNCFLKSRLVTDPRIQVMFMKFKQLQMDFLAG